MKIYLLLIVSLWFINTQFETGEYIHERNGFKYSLILNQDSSFTYSRPAIIFGAVKEKNGTIDESGKWRINQNNLVLIDSVGFVKSKSNVEGQTVEGQEFVTIKFIDENGSPLSNIEVGINEDKFYKRTDSQGIVRFNFNELKKRRKKQPKNTVEVIEFKTEKSEASVAVKEIFNNQITVIQDFNPSKTYKLRERRIEINNGDLVFRNPTGMNEQQEFVFTKMKK
ncbi:hypothetical protein [Algoriphagus litoralis]|uniref:hypothetical protein n=1 Tax=Algoriphagus litoralis TaxID=2202829 RepID=UPI000DBA3CC6|nr:hypothetical protein [Algoriphagus litoralis]